MGGRNRPDEEGYEGASVDRHTLTDSKDNNRLIRHFGYIFKRAIGRTIANWYHYLFEESPGSSGQAAR
jgi:hypothetical protein